MMEFDTIDDVVRDVAKGELVIVTDDADRENEGDLVMAAEKATPAAINFMSKHGRGLICVPVSHERALRNIPDDIVNRVELHHSRGFREHCLSILPGTASATSIRFGSR